MKRAVRLGYATLLGGADEALLGPGAGRELRERLGDERTQPKREKQFVGHEHAGQHRALRVVERPGDAL